MPIIEGTGRLKSAKGEFDFAVDGGLISTITLRDTAEDSMGNLIPNGAVIEGGYIEVDTLFTSGTNAGTVAVQIEAAGDLLAAAAVSGAPFSTTGRKSVLPAFTGATTLKTTAARSIKFVVAVEALTAGKGRVVVYYR